jgi:hypothetical protein
MDSLIFPIVGTFEGVFFQSLETLPGRVECLKRLMEGER